MGRKLAALFLCAALLMSCFCLMPGAAETAPDEPEREVVRVGWYETPFNHKDAFNRRTGYAYEYQRKIAAYTGWQYEYIEGTWSELLQLLRDGYIDMMSDVSFKEDRTADMLFSSLPMGEELYYLYVSADNTEISREDYTTLNGKTVGIVKDTIQIDLFRKWAEEREITVTIEEQRVSEAEAFEKLRQGKLDAFVTLESYGDPEQTVPLWKIGESDFYFAVRKDRPDLLTELDAAMSRIQEENKHYNHYLSQKYMETSGASRYLTVEEREWLESHGPIRVGYQDNYLAFCAADKSGELTGALKDYLGFAADALENAKLEFTTVAYPTAAEAMEALKKGEIDCMFPANLTDYDAEQAGVLISPPIMTTEMDAVVREADQHDFLRKTLVRVAVNQGNPNYEMFLKEHYPGWTPVYYTDTPECLKQVAAGNADCIIISNYRYRDIAKQCEKLQLTTVYTGVDMDYSFAVKDGDTMLYSILSRAISCVPDAAVNSSLAYYSAEPAKAGLRGFFEDYPYIAIATGVVILVLIVSLAIVVWRARASKVNSGQ